MMRGDLTSFFFVLIVALVAVVLRDALAWLIGYVRHSLHVRSLRKAEAARKQAAEEFLKVQRRVWTKELEHSCSICRTTGEWR
jgi:membrane protein YqaA with SNARE-associated domain